MRIAHHKEYSRCLGRDMEFNVYGHSGKPALAFPCQDALFCGAFSAFAVFQQPP